MTTRFNGDAHLAHVFIRFFESTRQRNVSKASSNELRIDSVLTIADENACARWIQVYPI